MVISGVNGTSAQMGTMGMSKTNDPVAKNIQSQIENVQKQMQELASNKEMSVEDKMKKRQELQQEISDLNNQLRQHQIEQRKERQQKKSSSDDIFDSCSQYTKNNAKAGKGNTGLSQASMNAMISADTSMKQAAVQGSVATKMEGRAGVLEIEIQMDLARNGSPERKKAELADVEQKAEEATTAQLGTLAEAGKSLQEAREADQSASDTKKDGENNEDSEEVATKANGVETNNDTVENEEEKSQTAIHYTPVDVRL